ncbi:MAG: [NiFe]-hydrogenase assembly chaperone HybE [Rhodoferax sp.]|uniref:[NiFe]-hydrogenase assembly chaperone HybE n=1 Tax=Rhodoferax sp. TaxID=50421 RepID=UPI001B4933F0|nr:[NiFe]-hydrogenase assembly chaperone HybE [Rhodoferax sp.]MBP9905431.1 [NiFe]-hydrogenase assembly chaperone HybE [Rhodoferax sp.]
MSDGAASAATLGLADALRQRVAALEALFDDISNTRMAGVPVKNPALKVQAVGFAPVPHQPDMLQGVLITPWFMNLVRLPLRNETASDRVLAERQKATRQFGNTDFEFIGSFEVRIGAFEVCSLYSPMFEFADHAAATATAQEVLNQLHRPTPGPARTAPAVPSRRGFLLGRSAGGAPGDRT